MWRIFPFFSTRTNENEIFVEILPRKYILYEFWYLYIDVTFLLSNLSSHEWVMNEVMNNYHYVIIALIARFF